MREPPVLIAEPSWKLLMEYVVALGAAGLLYGLTCAPAILWQDSALFTYRILHNDIVGNLGLAVAHPLYVMIGILVKQIPVGDLAHRVNLISAIFGAIAIANTYLLMVLWLNRRFPSIVAAITLAVSWTFWQHSVIAECYTLYMAILTAEMLCLLRYFQTQTSRVRWLYLLAFLNGLSIANHMLGMLPLACYMVLIGVLLGRRVIGIRHLLLMALLWVVGVLPYAYIIADEMIRTGDVAATLASAVFGKGWEGQVLNTSLTPRMVLENFVFIALNFPTPNIVFLVLGIVAILRLQPHGFVAILIAVMVLFFAFAFRYTVPDRHAFFFPFYVPAAMCIGAGAYSFSLRRNSTLVKVAVFGFALLPVGVYFYTPTLGRHFYKSLSERRQVPYRDDYKYWLQPWQTGYRGGERFAAEALGQVERNAVIYADSTTVHAILYMQEQRGMRPDVGIVSSSDHSPNAPALTEQTVDALLASSAVYVVSAQTSYCPQYLLDNYDTVREGVLYRVLKRKGS
jgi:hypothetical protein